MDVHKRIANEIKEYLALNGITMTEVAARLGCSQQAISNQLSGRKIGENVARMWAKEFGFNPLYLMTGEGSLHMERDMFGIMPKKRVSLIAAASVKDDDALCRVRLIPYEARGGMIGDFVDGVHDYDCEMVISPIKGVDFAMTVTGDSMVPEYNPGDRILIKRIDPNLFIEWGRVYVLDTPNGAVVKKLMPGDDPNFVSCISINPEVSPFQVNVNSVRGWYRVMMVMSMK